jgi:hypothetical protein
MLNYHQTPWSEFLLCFDFKIDYRPGKAYGKAYVLTCQRQGSEEDSDLQEIYCTQILLKSHNLDLLADIPSPNGGTNSHNLLQTACKVDPFPSEIL